MAEEIFLKPFSLCLAENKPKNFALNAGEGQWRHVLDYSAAQKSSLTLTAFSVAHGRVWPYQLKYSKQLTFLTKSTYQFPLES